MHYCGKYRLIVIMLLVFVCNLAKGQEMNSGEVNSLTYQLYLDKKWDSLITVGNKAIKEGTDYYYLRIRLGVAYYEERNYIKAASNFKKALAFNSGDDVAMEYLYYCYLYTNQFEQAKKLSRKFSKELARKTKTDSTSAISFILAEGGVRVSDSSTLFKPASYGQFGIEHYIARRFSLFHALTYLSQRDFTGAVSQFQYYLRGTIPLNNNWTLAPTFQWLNKGYTPPPPLGPPPRGRGYGPPPPTSDTGPKTTYTNYFLGSFSFMKVFSHTDFALGTTISEVYGTTQYLHSFTFNYFPFDRNKLTIGCALYSHTENSYSTINYAINPYLKFRIIKPLSITASYLWNNKGANIIEYNGYIINNSADLTQSRFSIVSVVSVSSHADIYAIYQYESKLQNTLNFTYHYNLFSLGILIKP